MKRMSRTTVKRCAGQILRLSVLAMLISTTGCSRHYVTVNGDERVQVNKGELDRLYQDNELLLQQLEECRSGR